MLGRVGTELGEPRHQHHLRRRRPPARGPGRGRRGDARDRRLAGAPGGGRPDRRHRRLRGGSHRSASGPRPSAMSGHRLAQHRGRPRARPAESLSPAPGGGPPPGPRPPRRRTTAARGRRDGGVGVLHRLVGHRLGHLDQRLHAAERLGQREDLGGGRDARRVGVAERDHPAEAGPAHVLDTPRARRQELAHRAPVLGCAPPPAGAACAARGGRGSSRTARAPRPPRSARSAPGRAGRGRPPPPRRRPRRSARRGTWWRSAPRRRRPARAGAAPRAWRTCCPPPPARCPRAPPPPRCRPR